MRHVLADAAAGLDDVLHRRVDGGRAALAVDRVVHRLLQPSIHAATEPVGERSSCRARSSDVVAVDALETLPSGKRWIVRRDPSLG